MIVNNYDKPIEIRRFSDEGKGYEFSQVLPYELTDDMTYKYIPGSSLPESRASRMDQAIDLLQLGLLDAESFWRWTQADITKDILDQIAQSRAQKQEQMQGEMDIIGSSTDENEILEALLRQRELSGAAEQTRNVQVEGERAKNQ